MTALLTFLSIFHYIGCFVYFGLLNILITFIDTKNVSGYYIDWLKTLKTMIHVFSLNEIFRYLSRSLTLSIFFFLEELHIFYASTDIVLYFLQKGIKVNACNNQQFGSLILILTSILWNLSMKHKENMNLGIHIVLKVKSSLILHTISLYPYTYSIFQINHF